MYAVCALRFPANNMNSGVSWRNPHTHHIQSFGGFLKLGIQNNWLITNNASYGMNWGVPYFKKPPSILHQKPISRGIHVTQHRGCAPFPKPSRSETNQKQAIRWAMEPGTSHGRLWFIPSPSQWLNSQLLFWNTPFVFIGAAGFHQLSDYLPHGVNTNTELVNKYSQFSWVITLKESNETVTLL